jgi:ABC-2 type transport system permease protein
MYGRGGVGFSQLETFLGADLNVQQEDLTDGSVSGDADILLLAAPKDLDEIQLFAVDQFLMQGGTVIMASSPYSASLTSSNLTVQKNYSGMENWLQHHGLTIEDKLVLDSQNSAYPVPVTRSLGGFRFQELRMLDYPYFIDVRDEGLNHENLITSELPQVTMAWASPIVVDEEKQQQRSITRLLNSSDRAWLSDSLDVMPKITRQGPGTFVPQGVQASQLLGVVSQGRFDSYFAGKPSPLVEQEDEMAESKENTAQNDAEQQEADDELLQIGHVIERSPESSRIILFSSNDFLRDQVIQLAGSAQQTRYLNTMQLLVNAVDWSLEDAGLLSIRSRSHFNRTLPPMEQSRQMFWEYLNYVLAAFALIIIALLERRIRRMRQQRYVELLAQ